METALDLADLLGRKRIAEAVGVGATAVSNAVVRGSFPAAWFMVMSHLAKEAGVDCPPGLFKMIPAPDHTPKVECFPDGNNREHPADPSRPAR